MKICHKIRQKLSAYQDGEVSQSQRDNIKAHLGNCDSCRKYLADLGQTYQLINSLPQIKPDPMFTRKVINSVAETSLWNRLFGKPLRLFPVPSAAIAMIIVGLLTGTLLGNLLIQNPYSLSDHSSSSYSGRELTLASLTVFDAIPIGSIADGYFNMVSTNMEYEYEK
ncbi:MAG: zf-HC2 domain-containing protein [Desulfobacula sp.]|jgi:predicted anti-sigma-YlaC factor YlaD|uniref:anti-sigma factor family protein n=1 Tax=Desulfobacula sp. TaxID=2593537 RepID=UPI001DAA805D|nr:zf-HC2 domain-containing protein [Desulfobacula sp.]MBT3805194.1 zf-HC2 domain-containing protein [Desulfobacula sp.]MBT4027371.1 zf-HC2 domain-containing protein [Desulfobacula sp.]MBT4201098.1 zf-HC2 domain-containing protein [Desulfobacula sp.]MBT4508836.1 zf-HC2 domain-containing protein [Desulfobacula sp.]